MQKISVHQAVGRAICHDITEIVPGKVKGVAFKKGHIIRETDIPKLLNLGKENIYIWEDRAGLLHEDEAALRIAAACAGKHLSIGPPSEGKVNFIALERALLKVKIDTLGLVNSVPEVVVATRHSNQVVERGEVVAGTRVIPLAIPEDRVATVEAICAKEGAPVYVLPLFRKTIGVVVTGNEVYYGRIADKFGPVLSEKVLAYSCRVLPPVIVPDDAEQLATQITALISAGAEIILVSGGMSVDPDDVTPRGIALSGAVTTSYGAPVLPGSMFMLSYLGEIPILGLPGCVMYSRTTIFDLLLPRLLAGERLTKEDIAVLGHGGLCLGCSPCIYPHCPFGK